MEGQSSFFQFRVANKLFGNNSGKTHSIAKEVCNGMNIKIDKFDDTDTSVCGYAGFFVKLNLDTKVDADEFIGAFQKECVKQDLAWGTHGEICLASEQWKDSGHIGADIAIKITEKYLSI